MINYLVTAGTQKICTHETRLNDCVKEYSRMYGSKEVEVVDVHDCSSICCDCGWNPTRHFGLITKTRWD